ncbi:DivIVA domain-containing protein [Propionibacteriaceae bacterium Y1923]|uniref:DivIVA domain-containing protein n=1 Tax=Aestuariimicrobium sp. Y1814 TaxID=3418742 RepID=UPI003C16397E
MTLSLSEVRAIRFPIARRGTDGYRAGEVDDFVDKVDITFTSILEENDRLKAQLEALKNDSANTGGNPEVENELRAEVERLRAELEEARQQPGAAPVADDSELRGEVERLRQREHQLNQELQQARQQPPAAAAISSSGNVERIEVSTSEQASPVVIRLVQLATEQAENLVAEAEAEAARKRAEADRDAEQTTAAARAEAERLENAARAEAERLEQEARAAAEDVNNKAQAHAEQVTIDANNRREELFSTLERERDEFQGKVDSLRGFESGYRSRLVEHLRQQAEAVEQGHLEPEDIPSLVGDERGKSATPRLDALLAEKN